MKNVFRAAALTASLVLANASWAADAVATAAAREAGAVLTPSGLVFRSLNG